MSDPARVSLLIDQLKQLVEERRRLEARATPLTSYRAEIARLSARIGRVQRQLANAVKHDLSDERALG